MKISIESFIEQYKSTTVSKTAWLNGAEAREKEENSSTSFLAFKD